MMISEEKCLKFIDWLVSEVEVSGKGADLDQLENDPSGVFYLGKISPEERVALMGLGDRGDRLEPCSIGVRFLLSDEISKSINVEASFHLWIKNEEKIWKKTDLFKFNFEIQIPSYKNSISIGNEKILKGIKEKTGLENVSAEIRVDRNTLGEPDELIVTFVNCSDSEIYANSDGILYESKLTINNATHKPYYLEALPDSFRYDRRIEAYGINCSVYVKNKYIETTDLTIQDKYRPDFQHDALKDIDLSFKGLSEAPLEKCKSLLSAYKKWGDKKWSDDKLHEYAGQYGWSDIMLEEAKNAAHEYEEEVKRISNGIDLLQKNELIMKSFKLMNESMLNLGANYNSWRPFQVGFLLANLNSLVDKESEANLVDIVWFATGGGKTETYLGLILTAAFFDRLKGKITGVTAWSRFPLRMLSLQQTQRFANALAAAEIIRKENKISGAKFSLGFYVGSNATPNSIPVEPRHGQPDPDDENMPNNYKLLQYCPFCHKDTIKMDFNRILWKLEHVCVNTECPSQGALPFYIVDDEIYRFLPTVIVGTLDKAAVIGLQSSMRGIIGSPHGFCEANGHGHTYAKRSRFPNGCLVPGCKADKKPLPMDENLYGMSFRLQDEIHLLKDSLGAVDAHYESLLDSLQFEITNTRAKILGSSATLAGYEKHIDILYKREARVFPTQGVKIDEGFWSTDSSQVMRKYIAISPRGVTLEYAVDKIITKLQILIREIVDKKINIEGILELTQEDVDKLVDIYGTNVIYGNTLRDLEATMRSLETQILVKGELNTASLTGQTAFDEVISTLKRIEEPEIDYYERLHVITASSMMSHGVDLDRLNIMIMLGVPLTTSEFIQSTARVGRKYPGFVFVMHKIGRERDAGIYRSFNKFIEQGDRFVEPIPITRRSRRVLERTIAALALSRIIFIHEPKSEDNLTTVLKLRKYVLDEKLDESEEVEKIINSLELDINIDASLISDIKNWYNIFIRNLNDPTGTFRFPSELSPTGQPMRSLRDVEENAPIIGGLIK